MNTREKQVDQFFNHYRDVFNAALLVDRPEIQQTSALFSSCIIAADPSSVNCARNNKAFRTIMQNGYAFYRRIGITSIDIVAKTIVLLDDFHTMARIRWRAFFTRKNGTAGKIDFENIYFIQSKDTSHQVFGYITGDEQAALKAAGLV
jgi:hypothetical protein